MYIIRVINVLNAQNIVINVVYMYKDVYVYGMIAYVRRR